VIFTGIVLAGGASKRMGRDKALVELDGHALVSIGAAAMQAAGADHVLVVGGDEDGVRALGLDWIPDEHPGEGPLGGVISGLRASPHPLAVVLACDMPRIDADTVERLVAALVEQPQAMAAVAVADEQRQALTAAYRHRILPILERAFAAGERAPRRALEAVRVVEVAGLDPERLADVDRPEDLSRYDSPGSEPPAAGKVAP